MKQRMKKRPPAKVRRHRSPSRNPRRGDSFLDDLAPLALVGGAGFFAWQQGWLAPIGIPAPPNPVIPKVAKGGTLPADWYSRQLAAYDQRRAELGRSLTKDEWVTLMSGLLPMVTAADWAIVYDKGMGYIAAHGVIAPNDVQNGWLQELGYTIAAGDGTDATPSMTFDQACVKARQALGWGTNVGCDQVKAEVCRNPTLFVERTGDSAAIRKAFGCPL